MDLAEEDEKPNGDLIQSTCINLDSTNQSHLPFPKYNKFVFKCFSQTCWPRSWLLKLITSPWFEKATILIIIINCFVMGMYEPCNDEENCTSARCLILKHVDDAIYVYFLVEMLIKLFSMGVIGKRSYLSEGWNWLDMFIVFAG